MSRQVFLDIMEKFRDISMSLPSPAKSVASEGEGGGGGAGGGVGGEGGTCTVVEPPTGNS
jgi:hypothetical protein